MSRPLLYDRSCRCPACRQRLGGLPVAVKRCPRCRRWMEPLQVWSRRRYPGLIEVPGWALTALLPGAVLPLAVVLMVLPEAGAVAVLVTAGVVGIPTAALAWARWMDPRLRKPPPALDSF